MAIPVTTPSVLLMGGPGAGKTYSIVTLLEAGLEVFVIITEATGLESLLDAVEERKLDINKLHWRLMPPNSWGMKALYDQANKVHTLSLDDLMKIKSGLSKMDCIQYLELLKQIEDFKCDRTGEHYGDATTWTPDRALVLDSLTGLNQMVIDNAVGMRPTLQLGEYNVLQNLINRLASKLCESGPFFVMTAHITKQQDETTSAFVITINTIGKKLAPQLMIPFSEVVYCYRDGMAFHWSTASRGVDTKPRALALGDKILPSFVPIVERYRQRVKLASGDAAPSSSSPPKVVDLKKPQPAATAAPPKESA